MEFQIVGISWVKMEYSKELNTSKHIETKIELELSRNLDRNKYLDKNGLPIENGAKAMTQAFIQGLIANIHHCQEKGFWKDTEHIKYIIEELSRGFAEVAHVGTSEG